MTKTVVEGRLGQEGRFLADFASSIAGIDWDVGPRRRSEARSVIEVIMAIVVASVPKTDLRPVDLSVSTRYQNILEKFFSPTSTLNAFMQHISQPFLNYDKELIRYLN